MTSPSCSASTRTPCTTRSAHGTRSVTLALALALALSLALALALTPATTAAAAAALALALARYEKRKIYTYINNLLVALNPYQLLPLYGEDLLKVRSYHP